mmetsp:Transcript_37619/g.60951  ORF Transcript_37619/g.60951 Transcript_37619/m.60951 type:complete len:89 (+) Transcript_37619:634-900(+)
MPFHAKQVGARGEDPWSSPVSQPHKKKKKKAPHDTALPLYITTGTNTPSSLLGPCCRLSSSGLCRSLRRVLRRLLSRASSEFPPSCMI